MRYEESVAVILESLPQDPHSRIGELFHLLAQTEGKPDSSDFVAHQLNFGSRFRLAQAVKQVGLPSVRELCSRFQILGWVKRWEEGQDPAVRYRKLKRVTGKRWTEIRGAGLTGVVTEPRNSLPPPKTALSDEP